MKYNLSHRSMVVVVSAPSGGGKSTILKRIVGSDPLMSYSISATSRPRRLGETNGIHYDFLTEPDFKDRISRGDFLEHAVVYGHFYGTLKSRVTEKLDANLDVAMDLDCQGGLSIKQQIPDSVLIYLLPPSLSDLRQRLLDRNQDSEEVINIRMNQAVKEIEMSAHYDYIVMNDNLDDTVRSVESIIKAERSRKERVTIKQEVEQGSLS